MNFEIGLLLLLLLQVGSGASGWIGGMETMNERVGRVRFRYARGRSRKGERDWRRLGCNRLPRKVQRRGNRGDEEAKRRGATSSDRGAKVYLQMKEDGLDRPLFHCKKANRHKRNVRTNETTRGEEGR